MSVTPNAVIVFDSASAFIPVPVSAATYARACGQAGTVGALLLELKPVLGALLQQPDTELYGLEIVRATGLEPGTIYPILQRLRGSGSVSDRWEDPEPAHAEGRPPRRYYRLTTEGRARAIHALQRGRDRSGLGRLLAPPRSSPPEAGPA